MSTDSITPDIGAEVPATSTPETAMPAAVNWDCAPDQLRNAYRETKTQLEI
jgi:hypothetical protein